MSYNVNATKIDGSVVYKTKSATGQILTFAIDPYECDNAVYWTVVFWIGKRKQGYQYKKQTGNDGLKPLIWAKSCLVDFMSKLNDGKRHHVCISWDDNKRKRVYARGLSDLGFKMCRLGLYMVLLKTI